MKSDSLKGLESLFQFYIEYYIPTLPSNPITTLPSQFKNLSSKKAINIIEIDDNLALSISTAAFYIEIVNGFLFQTTLSNIDNNMKSIFIKHVTTICQSRFSESLHHNWDKLDKQKAYMEIQK